MNTHLVISWYKFIPIENPKASVKEHKAFMSEKEMVGRIYISEEGINAQLSGTIDSGKEYMEWVKNNPKFQDVAFKCQEYHEHAFPKLTVKVRKELVAMGEKVDLSKSGKYVSPSEWKEMLKNDDIVKLDVRNDYEWELGHFEGFEKPNCKTFKDFPNYAREIKERVDPKKTKVMMCCTGGIRCEVYSALMKEEGFSEVYQLDGGILKYGEEEKGKHWLGKLFVFDDRLGVDVNSEEPTSIAKCFKCGNSAERILNCANMDCNELFFSCPDCIEAHNGCCQESCQQGPRVRPLDHQKIGKPFRKWYKYFDDKSANMSVLESSK